MSIWKKALYVTGATVGIVGLGVVAYQIVKPKSEASEETTDVVTEVAKEVAQEFFNGLFEGK